MRLNDIVDTAKEDLIPYLEDDPTREPHEAIHEVADQSVPIYTSDLMDLAANHNVLATTEPELGPAYDGTPTPVNIIAANVYEYVEGELWAYHRELMERREELLDDPDGLYELVVDTEAYTPEEVLDEASEESWTHDIELRRGLDLEFDEVPLTDAEIWEAVQEVAEDRLED